MMRKQTNTLLSALAFAFASATVSVPSMLVASDAVAQEQKASEKKTRRVPTLRGKVYEQLARAQTAADEAGNVYGAEVRQMRMRKYIPKTYRGEPRRRN